jgi:chromosome segregation ATPase
LSRVQSELDVAVAQVDQLTRQLKQNQSQLQHTQKSGDEKEATELALRNELNQVQTQLAISSTEQRRLNGLLADITNQNAKLHSELSNAKENATSLKSQFQQLQAELKAEQDKVHCVSQLFLFSVF